MKLNPHKKSGSVNPALNSPNIKTTIATPHKSPKINKKDDKNNIEKIWASVNRGNTLIVYLESNISNDKSYNQYPNTNKAKNNKLTLSPLAKKTGIKIIDNYKALIPAVVANEQNKISLSKLSNQVNKRSENKKSDKENKIFEKGINQILTDVDMVDADLIQKLKHYNMHPPKGEMMKSVEYSQMNKTLYKDFNHNDQNFEVRKRYNVDVVDKVNSSFINKPAISTSIKGKVGFTNNSSIKPILVGGPPPISGNSKIIHPYYNIRS